MLRSKTTMTSPVGVITEGVQSAVNWQTLFCCYTYLVTLGCWIARLRCRSCTAGDCRDFPKIRSLQNKTNQLAFQCVKTITLHTRSPSLVFQKPGWQFERGWGGRRKRKMIVIVVRAVKQVIYFFFISLKLCNTEQYRMWHWRRLPLSHLGYLPFLLRPLYFPAPSNKYRVVINCFMHTFFFLWCNKFFQSGTWHNSEQDPLLRPSTCAAWPCFFFFSFRRTQLCCFGR